MAKKVLKACPLCKRKTREKDFGNKIVREPAVVPREGPGRKGQFHCRACGGFFTEK